MLAAIRPDSWNYALFLHVLGAAVLVGALVTAGSMQILGWARDQGGGAAMFARLSFRTLLIVAIPAWFAMRIGAEWIRSKEFPSGADEPGWIGIGYVTAEPGGLLLLISVVLAGIGARRLARGPRCRLAHALRDCARPRRARCLPGRPLGDDREARLARLLRLDEGRRGRNLAGLCVRISP